MLNHCFHQPFFTNTLYECLTIWVSDEVQHFVGTYLDPNCLQRLPTVIASGEQIIKSAGEQESFKKKFSQ